MKWGLQDATADPGEGLLRLVTQSAARAQRYADELEALVAESPSLREALVADVWVHTDHGESYKAGEYIRVLAKLEAEERDRCANFATKAIAAGGCTPGAVVPSNTCPTRSSAATAGRRSSATPTSGHRPQHGRRRTPSSRPAASSALPGMPLGHAHHRRPPGSTCTPRMRK